MIGLFSNSAYWLKKSVALTAALALMQAPFATMLATKAEARVKVGVTSAVIPDAVMGDKPGELKTVTVGAKVDQDVVIETGARGRTQVLFVDGSSMNIGPKSRIIIDEFVFDASQLSGNLGARIEKGSMRFIGGVLSKREKQVKFNAGDATVGIRGGIAKLALEDSGTLKAELVHGKISITTPEGLFETDRIGTLIERDIDGVVDTRTVTTQEKKAELDDEAKENLIVVDEPAQEQSPSEAQGADAPAPADAEADVLAENPVENGLVEIDENGNLKSSDELIEIDPEAAKLIDDGAIAIDENGNVNPTEKMLEVDPVAKKMVEDGLLEVDENGFLVPSQNFDQAKFYDDVETQEGETSIVSDVTLAEFGFSEPELIATEESYKSNLASTEAVLKNDPTSAKLFELGQLEIDGDGFLKPSEKFSPLSIARVQRTSRLSKVSFVEDNAADKLLLKSGVFDTKITTRVVGADLAESFYSAEVTKVVRADIVRDDAINAIERLASANDVAVPDDIKQRNLDELVTIGGALSTRDALKASIVNELELAYLPEVTIGAIGSEDIVSISVSDEAADALNISKDETDFTTESLDDWFSGALDPNLLIGLTGLSDDSKTVATRSVVDTGTYDSGATFNDPLPEEKTDNGETTDSSGFYDIVSGEIDFDAILKSVGIVVEPVSDEKYYESPAVDNDVVIVNTPIVEVIERQEDAVEEDFNDFDLWKLNIAGQRVATGATQFGDPGPSWIPFRHLWEAYNSSHGDKNSYIAREADNRVLVSFDMNTYDATAAIYGDPSRRNSGNKFAATSNEPSGSVKDLLALNNFAFKAAVEVLAGYPSSTYISNEPEEQTLTFTANDMSAMATDARSVNSGVSICTGCDQVATGIWQNDSFTNESLSNISYQHKGHWAIGQPLSSDTLRQLAGMKASFTGHAVGTVITPTLNETGYGTAVVNVDFANPTSGTRNNFRITDFRSENYVLDDIPNMSMVLDTSTGEFSGKNFYYDTVDGALYGDYKNLQAGGTFAISRSTNSANEVSISGSFAAKATSISK